MVSLDLSRLFKAVADPTRRRILELLGERQRTVSEIAALFPMSRPAVSKHLRVLREAGLAVERRKGRQRVYAREIGGLEFLADWLGGLAPPSGASRATATEPALRIQGRREGRAAAGATEASSSEPLADELSPESQEHEWRSW